MLLAVSKTLGTASSIFYGKRFHVHRVVWAIHNQMDPGIKTIDHIDRNPSNNTPENLRLATHEGQLRNIKRRKSKYGRGVKKVGNRYYARMHIKGKDVSLGGFLTPEEALQVAESARVSYLEQQHSTLYPNFLKWLLKKTQNAPKSRKLVACKVGWTIPRDVSLLAALYL